MSRFEDMLRLYMRVNNISQRQLAKDLDMPIATLHRILHGKDCQVSNLWNLFQWLADPLDKQEHDPFDDLQASGGLPEALSALDKQESET